MGLIDFNKGAAWEDLSHQERKDYAKKFLSDEDYKTLQQNGEFGDVGMGSFGNTMGKIQTGISSMVNNVNSKVEEAKEIAANPPAANPDSDLSKQGWGEQFWANNQGFAGTNHTAQAGEDFRGLFTQPTASEQLWQQRGAAPMENRSDAEYDRYQMDAPEYGAYYDNAYTRGENKINQALAARGQFGSTQGMQAITDLGTGIEAERANREAEFRQMQVRDRANIAGQADQVDLSNLLGQSRLADSATSSSLERAKGGMSLAGMLDENERADFSTGMTAATNAQGLREGRVRGAYQDMMALPQAAAPIAMGGFNNLFAGDEAAMEQELAAMLGISTEELRQRKASQQNARGALGSIFGMIGSFYGGGGAGAAGNQNTPTTPVPLQSQPGTTWAGGGGQQPWVGTGVRPEDL